MNSPKTEIRTATAKDAAAVAEIYNHYINNTVITFETDSIDQNEMSARITTVLQNYPFLVLELDQTVIAYAYADRWKGRKAYDQTCESSIYVAPKHLGQSYGKLLYTALIQRLKTYPIKRVLGGIALPNKASIGLHEKLGYEFQGTLREVGFKFGKWIDVGYWQLFLS